MVCSANNRVGPRTASRGESLETIVVMEAAEHRRRDDAVTVRYPMPLQHRKDRSTRVESCQSAVHRTYSLVGTRYDCEQTADRIPPTLAWIPMSQLTSTWFWCPMCHELAATRLPMTSPMGDRYFECDDCGHVWKLTALPVSTFSPRTLTPTQKRQPKSGA